MVDHKLERFLKSWIDGELKPDQAADVAAYLKANPHAQAEVADYRNVAAVIRKVARTTPIPIPRPDVIKRRALRREQEERQVIQWLQRVTAAAAVLLVTTLGMLFMSTSTGEAGIALQSSAPGIGPDALHLDQGALVDQAMILAFNDPSWEMPDR